MPRQPLVDERVVGVDQIQDAAILADDGLEQQFRLAPERVAEVAVELLGAGRDVVELPQLQPLARQIVDERAARGIGQHAPRLLLEHRGDRTSRPFAASPSSSSSGMLLQRKKDSRDASSRSLIRYTAPARRPAGSRSNR